MNARESLAGRRLTGGRRARLSGARAVLAGVVGVAAAGMLLLGAGCTSTATSAPASADLAAEPARAAATPTAPGDARAGSVGSSGGGAGQAAQTLSAVPTDGRQVILTAALAVRLTVPPVAVTDDAAHDAQGNADERREAVAQASGAVRGAATAAGGYVSGADGDGSTMTISVRVPAEQYDAVVDKIAALGVLSGRSETSKDVTAEIVDVNSRVESMTASVARVRALLAQATGIGDVIAIESELATREADLESLQQQQASLAGLVALSMVTVTLTAVTDSPAAVPADAPSGFVAGLTSGWNALLGFLAWIGTVLGALLPFLPVVAALVAAGWWVVRRVRRRARQQVVPAPAAADDVRSPETVGASTA
ncbi:MAG TPA: DUF4349 domain-containing protein [Nakamurella sp.]|nr:DUF4349 domain-containing protein [Nakamurella sp.]